MRKFREGEVFDTRKGISRDHNNPMIGRPKTKFSSVEEERDYLKAQVEYLKKRYPNLHGEGGFQK